MKFIGGWLFSTFISFCIMILISYFCGSAWFGYMVDWVVKILS